MKKTIFKGSGVALVTPMTKEYMIDYEVLEELLEYQIAYHTDAIIISGTTGEGSTLTEEEHKSIIEFAVKHVRHRVPVIAGAGSNNTMHAVELAKMAEKAGADALLEVTPYYNKCSQTGLVRHFGQIASATRLPVILYNIPSRTGVNIRPETYKELIKNENITAVKEASGNLSQIAKIASLYGDKLDIYSGNDDQITSSLSLGAKGVISVLANILPEETHNMCQYYFDNCPDKSDELQLKYFELIESLFFDVNPIPVKAAMNYMNIKAGPCRLPLCEMDSIAEEKLLKVLKKYGLADLHLLDDKWKASILHEPVKRRYAVRTY